MEALHRQQHHQQHQQLPRLRSSMMSSQRRKEVRTTMSSGWAAEDYPESLRKSYHHGHSRRPHKTTSLRPTTTIIVSLLLTLLLQLHTVSAQYCLSFNNTWDGLVQTLEDSGGWALLCPFEISGDRCPKTTKSGPKSLPLGRGAAGASFQSSPSSSSLSQQKTYNEGYVVDNSQNLFIICDPFMYGFDLESNCVINCPGRHFTVRPHAKLTLDRMTLIGATDSSIKVQSHGYVSIINTMFQNNILRIGNGGAISALGNSYVGIEFSMFDGNSAFNGGAIYNMGYTNVNNTHFYDNKAIIGGGALYSGASSNTKLRKTDFVNNQAGYYGEAIYDRFNTDVSVTNVEGCGNELMYRSNSCNGVYVRVSRRQVRCVPFESECTVPPTQAPTMIPTGSPTTSPTSSFVLDEDESNSRTGDDVDGTTTASPSISSPPSESQYPSPMPSHSSYPSTIPTTTYLPSSAPSPGNIRRRQL